MPVTIQHSPIQMSIDLLNWTWDPGIIHDGVLSLDYCPQNPDCPGALDLASAQFHDVMLVGERYLWAMKEQLGVSLGWSK